MKENSFICNYCNKHFESGQKLGGHKPNCKSDPNYEIKNEIKRNKLKVINTGKQLSKETKDKISKSRTEYLKNNPDKVPYLLNHSSKISYPELTMIKYLTEYNIKGWIHQMQFSIYQIDFAFPEYKLCVEIDGSTHDLKHVKKIDKRRDKFLNDEGWNVLRITAKEVKNNIYVCINLILDTLSEKQIEIPKQFLNKQYYKEEKIRQNNKQKELKRIKKEKERQEFYTKRKQLILNSGIDFTKRGWLIKLSKYLNMTDNGVKKFMKLHMCNFYNNCL